MAVHSVLIRANPVTKWERYRQWVPSVETYIHGGSFWFEAYSAADVSDSGPYSCQFTLRGTENRLREMFENGLGRNVETWADGLQSDFEGYIHELVFYLGHNRYTVSLENVENKFWMRVDYDADGEVERSTTLEETDSQGRFGVMERVLSGGEMTSVTVADQAVQTLLNLRAWPKAEADIGGAGGRGGTRLEVFCRSYIATLGWRVWNQTAVTGTQGSSAEVSDIVGTRGAQALQTVWTDTADMEEGTTADFNAVFPAQELADFEEGNVTDFDATGASPTASAASLKYGSYGVEMTASGTTQEYGGEAYAQDNACAASFWFDPNAASISAVSPTEIFGARDVPSGLDLINVQILSDGAGAYQIRLGMRTDAGVATVSGWTALTDAYHWIVVMGVSASAAGENDSLARLYLDGSLIATVSGVDNDTVDPSQNFYGHYNGVAGNSGTFYMDHIYTSPLGGMIIAEQGAASAGSWGAAVVISGGGEAVYGELTGPTDEDEIAFQLALDPNTLPLEAGKEFTVAVGLNDSLTEQIRLYLGYNGANYYVSLAVREDGGTYKRGKNRSKADAYSTVQVAWKRSSAAGASNGRAVLWIGGEVADTLENVDNDTSDIDRVRFGVVSGPVTQNVAGLFFLDDCSWVATSGLTLETGVGQFIASLTVDSNATLVTKEYDTDRRPLDIIRGLSDLGDFLNVRWLAYMKPRDATQVVGRNMHFTQAAAPVSQ